MRIRRVELAPFEISLHAPVRTSRTSVDARPAFLLRVSHEEGRGGFGEAAPMPSQGTELPDVCRRELNRARSLVGQRVESLVDLDALCSTFGTPAARYAVELALLDLLSQSQGRTIAGLLAPTPRARVPVNALLRSETPDELAKEARERATEGFTTFKLKVGGRRLEDERRRLERAREAVGPAGSLRIDANGAWELREAQRVLAELRRSVGVALCEQPVARLDDLETLAREGLMPIAADELLADPGVAREVIERRAANALVLKPMVLGGLRPALALAARAHEAGMASLVTTTFDAAIARAGALHLACAVPDPLLACGLATGAFLASDVVSRPDPISRGFAELPSAPGLGVAPDIALAWEEL